MYRLHGRVQGVGFRWWTRSQADRLGIHGTVRNDSDGSVVVVAVGDTAALETFRDLLERGPSGAKVEQVEETAGPAATYVGFQITH